MSFVYVFFHGFLFILVSMLTVNGSLIRLSCRYPYSELCRMQHRNGFNQYLTVTNHNSNLLRANGNEKPLLMNSFEEDVQNLKEQLDALEYRHAVNNDLARCINLGDDSCNNGSIPGSGKDNDYLVGNGNPGKRSQLNGVENYCLNLGDDICINGSLPGSGKDNHFLNGNGSPGKRFY